MATNKPTVSLPRSTGSQDCLIDTSPPRSYTPAHHRLPVLEDFNVKTVAGFLSDSLLCSRCRRARRRKSSSTQTHSANQRNEGASDCSKPGERPGSLGRRSWRHFYRDYGWRKYLEGRRRVRSPGRRLAIPRCAGRQRQNCISDVHWELPAKFPHLQNHRRWRDLEDRVPE